MDYTDLELLAGRTFIDKDYDNAQKVAIVSDYFVNNMFDGDTNAALGSSVEISINGKYYTYYIDNCSGRMYTYSNMFFVRSVKPVQISNQNTGVFSFPSNITIIRLHKVLI